MLALFAVVEHAFAHELVESIVNKRAAHEVPGVDRGTARAIPGVVRGDAEFAGGVERHERVAAIDVREPGVMFVRIDQDVGTSVCPFRPCLVYLIPLWLISSGMRAVLQR